MMGEHDQMDQVNKKQEEQEFYEASQQRAARVKKETEWNPANSSKEAEAKETQRIAAIEHQERVIKRAAISAAEEAGHGPLLLSLSCEYVDLLQKLNPPTPSSPSPNGGPYEVIRARLRNIVREQEIIIQRYIKE